MQSHFLDRIGGSVRVRESVRDALSDGSRGVTAKVRWLPHAVPDLENSYEEGRPRWIHCTPLLGASGGVGIWMVVLVDEEKTAQPSRRFRQAPPVAHDVRRPLHTAPSGSPRDLSNRMDNLDLTDDYGRNDYGRNDYGRNDYGRNDYGRNDYGRNDYENMSRVTSPNGDRYNPDRNGTAVHRNILRDAMRSQQSNGRSTPIEQQRAGQLHSGASSLRTNRFGQGGSVDSFNI